MPDCVIRDELLESDRWLDLPTDTDRLAFLVLRMRSDDFGNIEGGLRRMFRLLAKCTQVKTEENAAVVLTHLADADMIRAYKDQGREFWHLPRSRPTGYYLVRKCPPSPWCNPNIKLGKHIRAIRNQGLAKNLPVTSHERDRDVLQGTGIGIGTGTGIGTGIETPETSHGGGRGAGEGGGVLLAVPARRSLATAKRDRATRLPEDWKIPEDWIAIGMAVHPDWTRAGVIRESLTFRDHWISVGGDKGLKFKWLATWRNWIRRTDKEPVR